MQGVFVSLVFNCIWLETMLFNPEKLFPIFESENKTTETEKKKRTIFFLIQMYSFHWYFSAAFCPAYIWSYIIWLSIRCETFKFSDLPCYLKLEYYYFPLQWVLNTDWGWPAPLNQHFYFYSGFFFVIKPITSNFFFFSFGCNFLFGCDFEGFLFSISPLALNNIFVIALNNWALSLKYRICHWTEQLRHFFQHPTDFSVGSRIIISQSICGVLLFPTGLIIQTIWI